MQRAWLSRGVLAVQPNDQMYMPAPQTLLVQWTLDACREKETDVAHVYNLARYWSHGLRFPAHGPTARIHLQKMLQEDHLTDQTLRAVDAVFSGEVQPTRVVRLWGFTHDILPSACLVPHLDRLLNEPLPTGKKLKITQVNPENGAAWLNLRDQLRPAAFKAGLELHLRANLISRQDMAPLKRSMAAWDLLQGSESVLHLLEEQLDPAHLSIPRLLAVILHYADSQTLRYLPWPAVQKYFAGNPQALEFVWIHLFNNHKTLLLSILPDIQPKFHARLLHMLLEFPEFPLEDDHCLPMMNLVRQFPAWTTLLDKMLACKDGYKKLGHYLLGSAHPHSLPPIDLLSHKFLSQLNAQQWRRMLMPEGRPAYNVQQLFNIWEVVRVHKLQTLATCSWLQQATLQAIPHAVSRLNKVSAGDVSLGLPPFYATLLLLHLDGDAQEAWLNDWLVQPSAEKMIVQAFQWFNPTIKVPPLRELRLLSQALSEKASIVDVLDHLSHKIETLELPNMLE